MANRLIIRGDSYAARRPFYTISFIDENNDPLDLTDCTVRVTYKPAILSSAEDSTDLTALIKHHITINHFGVVTSSSGLVLVGNATAGTIRQYLTAVETRAFPDDTPLYHDVELKDFNGEVTTWLFDDLLIANDGVTNRVA